MSPIAFYQITAGVLLTTTAVPLFRGLAYPIRCYLLGRRYLAFSILFDCDFFFYGNEVMLDFELLWRGIAFTKCAESAVTHAVSASAKKKQTTVL